MPDIDLAAIKARADADEDRTREARLYGDIPALLDLIHTLATDGGNRAAAYYLRACDAEKERDEAETEADRLRGLLAEAEKGRDRANQRLGNLTISLNDSLAPEIVRQKAEAWDEGHRTGWEHCQDGNYGTDHWDDDTPNPYGGQQ